MRKLLFLIIVFASLCSPTYAQQESNEIEVSLLTVSSGENLYSAFGHSALRIKNKTTGLDVVYNYGLFSFNSPNFYQNFIKGRLNYWLDKESYDDFLISYISENRKIQEQIFEMDSIQKQFFIDFLEINLKPENKYYSYHFFEDNCATRIRDLVLLTYEGIVFPSAKEYITYRELVHKYLNGRSWTKLGIDLILGVSVDKKTNIYEQMFLPDYLYNALDSTEYEGCRIVTETKNIFIPEKSEKLFPAIVSPLFIFSCVFVLALLFCFYEKRAKVFDFILFLLVGIVGFIICLLWFFTNHTNMQSNFNIIWAFPTHLIMAFFILSNNHGKFYRGYFSMTLIFSLLLLITWAIIPQKLNPALIPLVASISLRSLWNSFKIPYL